VEKFRQRHNASQGSAVDYLEYSSILQDGGDKENGSEMRSLRAAGRPTAWTNY